MSGSNVPTPTFTANGFVAPTQGEILAGVQADFADAFGSGLNPALDTPQGQLSSSQTAIVNDANSMFLAVANNVDPAYASGRFQDALGRIYFLERTAAEPTVVTGTCSGRTGVTIQVGAIAQAADGNLYVATTSGTIPVGGAVDVQFACSVTGPIACPAGSLSRIYQSVPGWDSVTNAADGVLGNNVETRAAFEARRRASVAVNARGTVPSVRGAVLQVADVLDAYVNENSTGAPVTTGGVSLAAHSLYVCVSGGADTDVATAIWTKKPPGCAYNGSTSVTIYDTTQGYAVPPAYTVTFQRAAALTIAFDVQMPAGPSVPADALARVQQAILNAFSGGDGGPRAQIGVTQYASRYIGPIAALGSWAQVLSLTVNGGASVGVNVDKIPTTTASDISVTFV